MSGCPHKIFKSTLSAHVRTNGLLLSAPATSSQPQSERNSSCQIISEEAGVLQHLSTESDWRCFRGGTISSNHGRPQDFFPDSGMQKVDDHRRVQLVAEATLAYVWVG